jgi:hypothetical protein
VQLVGINVVASDTVVVPRRDQGSDASALNVLSDNVEAVIYHRMVRRNAKARAGEWHMVITDMRHIVVHGFVIVTGAEGYADRVLPGFSESARALG